MAASWLRIAVVQFAPKLGEVHANIAKARELCRKLTPRSVDLVCFPEMIFSGYMFPDAPSIAPYLEHPHTGPTSTFCAELARHLQCHVVVGFPERLDPASESASSSALRGANAALLHDGDVPVHVYHKSNLFPTDLTWARPGLGFTAVALPGLGRTAVAICNDLNVARGEGWTSIEDGPYELAVFCRKEGVRVLVLLNAWLKPGERVDGLEGADSEAGAGGPGDDDPRVGTAVGTGTESTNAQEDEDEDADFEDADADGLEPNLEVLNYWAMRLRPLWAKETQPSETLADIDTDDQRDVLVIICNRTGRERGKTFAGSSAIFAMRPGSGRPRLLHFMGEREEGVHVWTARIGSDVQV
ncbi:carbon-nitrogen hydrolase [Chiua virens]|nr:carbon-nitrogen hydrolase [Chiua virens]